MDKLSITFQNQFNHLSPKDLENIMETLKDLNFLNEKGIKFSKKFWEIFIKGYDIIDRIPAS